MRKIGVYFLAILLVVGLFPQMSLAATNPQFDKDLEAYLKEVSEIRGFEVTKDHIEYSLSLYDESMEDYASVADLKESLGEVIKADLSNLEEIYEEYDLDEAGLKALLKDEYDEDLEDYVFLFDLHMTVSSALYPEGDFPVDIDPEELAKELAALLEEEFDLTEQEVTNFINHFRSIKEKLEKPETMEQLEALAERMMAFEDFTEVDELTSAQIAELLDIYNEFLNIFELKAEFSLIKGGTETPLSLMDMMKMKELVNAKLRISFYNLKGDFLGDIIITGEMVDSGTIIDTGKKIEKATEKAKGSKAPVKKTVKGGKLPNTASDYGQNALLGLALFAAGFVLFRKVRVR
ncbi:processed acidic surface protein [Neobacillus notoginsengisoli]|uniref:Processed acidic surface protein n=1 Tax=Neobacillus notoginsengisoli TaxID=1578198 RepID=A0A417YRE8_9BACI|nr:processed acidic surface protein [Neobacillus notoginsengisoli]RHW37240.1 processed acidic surface protein [Neobacillus notoginsengisoli]